jgi:histone-lysine N-methyltransferase SETMAR
MAVQLEKEHFRAIIYDYYLSEKYEKKPAKIHAAIIEKYGEGVLHVTTVQRWCNDFRFGRTSLKDAPRCGRPPEVVVDDNIERCRKLIEADRRISLASIATLLHISEGSAAIIISEHLEAKKLNSKWIPKKLSEAQKQERVTCAKRALRMYRNDKEGFLARIITQDESKFSLWDPPTSSESKSWVFPNEECSSFPRTSKTRAVTMLSIWWDETGPILSEFMPNGVTMNGQAFADSITSLRSILPKKRRGKLTRQPLLLIDNAPPHRAHVAQDAADTCGFQFISHPPYSPDLAPSDYFLFTGLKKYTRGKVWDTVEELEQGIITWLDGQPKDWFKKGIAKLVERWESVILSEGEYFE